MEHKGYIKIRFATRDGVDATAGLVLPAAVYHAMSIQDLSRLYPVLEATKMQRLQVSIPYSTQNKAFAHDFDQPSPTHEHAVIL